MSKLTDAHKEQIRIMRKEGKSHQEVKDFFFETYKIKLNAADICDAAAGIKATRSQINDFKKAYGCKRGRPPSKDTSTRQLQTQKLEIDFDIAGNEEFAGHIHSAYAVFERSFLSAVSRVCAKGARI